MANFLDIEQRTRLAGANRLEVLLFSLGAKNQDHEEVYGINVFKVKEVMNTPKITKAPDVPPTVEGMVSLRGNMVPVINLPRYCGNQSDTIPPILIITEYNKCIQGLLVNSVDNILRLEWNDIRVPPSMIANRMRGLITGVTDMSDGQIMMLLDVEKVFADTGQIVDDPSIYESVQRVETDKLVIFADDSSVARRQISSTLDQMGVSQLSANNGLEAWNLLDELASRADKNQDILSDRIAAIITDVEMPEMDGYVLTKKIKADPRFSGIPVIMHSSLSAEANHNMGKSVGADHYVAKFDPYDLTAVIRPRLESSV